MIRLKEQKNFIGILWTCRKKSGQSNNFWLSYGPLKYLYIWSKMFFSGITKKYWHLNTTQRTKLIQKKFSFLSFQHQTVVISHASSWSPFVIFLLLILLMFICLIIYDLNFRNEQKLCGEILDRMLSSLSAPVVLEYFHSQILSWLRLTDSSIQALSLPLVSNLPLDIILLEKGWFAWNIHNLYGVLKIVLPFFFLKSEFNLISFESLDLWDVFYL